MYVEKLPSGHVALILDERSDCAHMYAIMAYWNTRWSPVKLWHLEAISNDVVEDIAMFANEETLRMGDAAMD